MREANHAHRSAAEQHELAAHAHRNAAEHNEKRDNETGRWHAQRALEYSDQAYKLAKEAYSKSRQIVSIKYTARASHGRAAVTPGSSDRTRAFSAG